MKKILTVGFEYDDKKIDYSDVLSYILDILEDNKHPCIEFNVL
ncbi:hypothetical protein LCGC14_2828520 [marine sediment metagenome]|uniref:Uncharacterized protein n=1 Tax=marine sediment metagenome TaxID=412755 RepID=A0A0F8YET8_9ZZZZ